MTTYRVYNTYDPERFQLLYESTSKEMAMSYAKGASHDNDCVPVVVDGYLYAYLNGGEAVK
jgi:hypothetical protein